MAKYRDRLPRLGSDQRHVDVVCGAVAAAQAAPRGPAGPEATPG